jgi:hypothetical protein
LFGVFQSIENEPNESFACAMWSLTGSFIAASDREKDKHADVNRRQTYDDDVSNIHTYPTQMFASYVSCLNESEEEQRRDKSPGSLNRYSVYPLMKVAILEKMDADGTEEDGIVILSDPQLVPINYDQCCLWGDKKVTRCGATSHSERF